MKLFLLFLISFISFTTAESVKTGEFSISDKGIDAESFESTTGLDPARLKLKPTDGKYTYDNDNKAISWQVYVPKNYDPSKAAGVLVYINAGDGGKISGKWKEVMDKHNIIWIGADNAGNKFYVYWRVVMALEGLRRIKEMYSVNEERVYLSGFSGGGRVSSGLATSKPDLFKGAVYLCGCNRPGSKDAKELKKAKEHYYVFITGTKDMNLNDTKGVIKNYQDNNFDNTKLIVVDGMGHSTPEAKVMDDALEYLNTPIIQMGLELLKQAQNAEKYKKYAEAFELYKKAASMNAEGAGEKADSYRNELSEAYSTAKKAEEERDFITALQTYDALYKKFGKVLGKDAYDKITALKRDKQVILEIKAMLYYNKIAVAIKEGKSGEQVNSALKKVIESAPGSKAAELAEKDLQKLSQ